MIPIPDALTIVRVALYAALSPLCGRYNNNPKCYWLIAEEGATFPLMVYQSQDGGGQDASYLGIGGWQGDITIRALASKLSEAENLIAGVPAALESLANPAGYTIKATLVRPLVIPPKDRVWTAAQIYRIQLYRA